MAPSDHSCNARSFAQVYIRCFNVRLLGGFWLVGAKNRTNEKASFSALCWYHMWPISNMCAMLREFQSLQIQILKRSSVKVWAHVDFYKRSIFSLSSGIKNIKIRAIVAEQFNGEVTFLKWIANCRPSDSHAFRLQVAIYCSHPLPQISG